MTQNLKLQQYDDFIIKEIKIINYLNEEFDITNLRVKLEIYEDLFGMCFSGRLGVLDAMDLPHLLPFVGEERIRFTFSKPLPVTNQQDFDETEDFRQTFRIYHIADRQVIKNNLQSYYFNFISEEMFNNLTTVVQRGFSDKPYSEMVQIVYDELVAREKPIEIEDTKFTHDYVAGNLNPFQFFNTIASQAVSNEENGSFYVFYEDREKFNFVTLGKLVQQEPIESYVYYQKNAPNPELISKSYRPEDAEQEIINVEKYVQTSQVNTLENLKSGMYGSSFFHIDTIRKKTQLQEFKLSESFEDFKHIDSAKPYTESFDLLDKTDAHIKITLSDKDRDLQEHLIERDTAIQRTRRYDESLLKRSSQIFQMNTLKLSIKVSGDPRITVGKVIEFKLPQNQNDVSKEQARELDDYLQGLYLVTSIKHEFDYNKYTMTMEIMKDTLFSDIKFIDPTEKYKDIY